MKTDRIEQASVRGLFFIELEQTARVKRSNKGGRDVFVLEVQ